MFSLDLICLIQSQTTNLYLYDNLYASNIAVAGTVFGVIIH